MLTPLYNMNTMIDVFQGIKKSLTDRIIVDPVLNKTANSFITTQTEFAKMLVNNATELSKLTADRYTQFYFPKPSNK